MPHTVVERLRAREITITEPPPSGAFHLPFSRTGDLLVVSARQPIAGGERRVVGRVAKALDGDLERVVRCVEHRVSVDAAPDFRTSPEVIQGASELVSDVFNGEGGPRARVALGAGPLPSPTVTPTAGSCRSPGCG